MVICIAFALKVDFKKTIKGFKAKKEILGAKGHESSSWKVHRSLT